MFIVIATHKKQKRRKKTGEEWEVYFVYKDSWEAAETIEEAKEIYNNFLQSENLYSASIAGVIESTDYSPANFANLINQNQSNQS